MDLAMKDFPRSKGLAGSVNAGASPRVHRSHCRESRTIWVLPRVQGGNTLR